jgi:transglutaminase-like putative cysteine protease
MLLNIKHATTYNYGIPAIYALQQLRVRPHSNESQSVIDWSVSLSGAEAQTSFTDEHGNIVDLVEFLPDTKTVSVTVAGQVETHGTSGVVGEHDLLMPLWVYLRQTDLTKAGPLVRDLVREISADSNEAYAIDRLHRLSRLILASVRYVTGETASTTTAEDALSQGSGVCQDHTHIFLSAARLLGYPSRYVSGYLMMNDRVDQDASHAWAEAHIDGLGWVGFDVSNAISPDERYVHVARALDYQGCAPTTGFLMGAEQENLIVSLQVQQ